MKKFLIYLGVFLIFSVTAYPAGAKNDKKFAPPSEEAVQSDTYDVKGRPDLKVKVFVYHGKPADKPGKPKTRPSLVCSDSNVSDPDSSAIVGNSGLNLPNQWTYNLNTVSVPASVGKNNLVAIASNAFGVWGDEVGGAVNIARGADTRVSKAQLDGENIISWSKTSNSALAVSYLWYYTATGQIIEVDTIMNSRFPWAWSDPTDWPTDQTCAYSDVYDAQNVLTHELGHTMGLDDHYTVEYVDNTMYGYGSTGETKKDTLTTGDKSGVGVIYGF